MLGLGNWLEIQGSSNKNMVWSFEDIPYFYILFIIAPYCSSYACIYIYIYIYIHRFIIRCVITNCSHQNENMVYLVMIPIFGGAMALDKSTSRQVHSRKSRSLGNIIGVGIHGEFANDSKNLRIVFSNYMIPFGKGLLQTLEHHHL